MRQIRLDAFNETPYDIDWRIRDSYLPSMRDGLSPIADELIPVLEWKAIRILRQEVQADMEDMPDARTDPDGWRLWWLNEANHLSYHTGSIPDAKDHLSPAVRHAVNTLTVASRLRGAMEAGDVEKVAALSILLAMQALQGGYSIEHEAAKRTRDKAQQNSIGKINSGYARVEEAVIRKAKEIWKSSPEKRIGEVVTEIHAAISKRAKADTIEFPVSETVKQWIVDASKAGKLAIPEAARKGGRPKKK